MKGEMTGRLEVLVLLTRYGVRILTDNRRLPLPVFVFVVMKQHSGGGKWHATIVI